MTKEKDYKYKVFFKTQIFFPKSRISGKVGDCTITTNADIESVRTDPLLIDYVKELIQSQYKKVRVLTVDITGITELTPLKTKT